MLKTIQIDPLRFLIGLLIAATLSSLLYQGYRETSSLHSEIADLKTKISLLEIEQKKSKRHAIFSNEPVVKSGLKEQLFKQLYLINGSATVNKDDEKKIKFLPGELLVQDVRIVDQDCFFDLLGVLLDEDAILSVDLPPLSALPKAEQTAFRKLRKELIQFGIFEEKITTASDGKFRIRIAHPTLNYHS